MLVVGCRRALRGAAALALLLWLSAAARAQAMTIAVSTSSLSLPIHVADAQGYFAAEGLAVRIADCIAGVRCIRQMFDGKADVATVAELPVVINSFERDDFAVFATFVTSSRSEKLIVRRSAGITEPKQLEGRRVAVFTASSAHYFLDTFLLFNGVDPKRVVVVLTAPERVPQALQRREVDAAAAFEPFAFDALKALGADGAALPGPRIYTTSFNLVAARSTLAARQADLVKLLRAVERAQRFIREQPLKAQALLKARLGLGDDFIAWDWPNLDYRLGLDQSLIATMEGQARWALREGHVPAERRMPNFLHFVDARPLRAVAPASVTMLDSAQPPR